MFKFGLLEGEKISRTYRQSEAVLFKPVLIVFILIYIPWYFLLNYGFAQSHLSLLFFWTVLVLLYFINKYLLWLVNVYILTDKRLVSVGYQNLFTKQVLETPLDRILNVGFVSRGFWQTIFDFGLVEVQVPGLPEPLKLLNVSHPAEVKDELWRAHHAAAAVLPKSASGFRGPKIVTLS